MPDDPGDHRDLEIVDLRARRTAGDSPSAPFYDDLLQSFYDDLYLPAFPIPSQQEDPEDWRRMLWSDDPACAFCELHFLVVGRDLSSPERRELHGGMLFALYPKSRCAFFTYVVVAPQHRGRGLARRMFEQGLAVVREWERASGEPVRSVLAETDDPNKVPSEQDSIEPRQRLMLLQNMGWRIVDVPYTQPELIPGRGRDDHLLLIAAPRPGCPEDRLPAAAVRDFMAEFYTAFGVADPEADVDYRRSVDAMPGEHVPLILPELWLQRTG